MKEVLDLYLKYMGVDHKIKEMRVIRHWKERMGKTVASQTKEVAIYNKKLMISLHSSVLRHELMMMKDAILHELNEYAGEKVIDDIVFK